MKDIAPGKDEITVGMLRAGGPRVLCTVCRIIQDLWKLPGAQRPELVRSGVGIMLFKKGDSNDLNNYRCIVLLCILRRVVAKVIATRLRVHSETENLLPNTQWGFRPQR
eukprot:2147940-Pyramimonas_sp.AAC.1